MQVYFENDSVYFKKQDVCKMSYALYVKVDENSEKWNRIMKKEIDSIIFGYNEKKHLALPRNILSSDSIHSNWEITTDLSSNHLYLYKNGNNEVLQLVYVEDTNDAFFSKKISEISECEKKKED